jgi:5-formyltetrahydrofolate cyclo-ligase
MALAKTTARERGAAYRMGLSAPVRAEFDARIVATCQTELDWPRYGCVSLFLPIERQHEVDTWPLLRWLWEARPEVMACVPRMTGVAMEQVVVTPRTGFALNAWGIPEPVGGVVVSEAAAFDLVLSPLLAFDEAGHRAGHGGGYYDRFLARQRSALVVGLGYDGQRMGQIETEPHDVALAAVITERGLRRF